MPWMLMKTAFVRNSIFAFGICATFARCQGAYPAIHIPDPDGEMRQNGSIIPCGGYHTDKQACGNAIWNSKVIGQVQKDQTLQQVRDIMKQDPERRELAGADERWYYITDYYGEIVTVITFTDGRVVALTRAPWRR